MHNAVISALEKGRQWQWVMEVMREATETSCRLNIISFNAAMSACEKCDQWMYAVHLLEAAAHRSLSCDVVSFSACISVALRVDSGSVHWRCFIACEISGCHQTPLLTILSSRHAKKAFRRSGL